MSKVVLIAAVLFSGALHGSGESYYIGQFGLNPGSGHSQPISGSMDILFDEAGDLKPTNALLDQPLFGRKFFEISEIFGHEHTQGESVQIVGVLKFDKTPHRFFFSFVSVFHPGKGYAEGTFFRIDDSEENIKATIESWVDTSSPPGTWKAIGDASFYPRGLEYLKGE